MRKAARFLISVVLVLGMCFLFLNLKTNTYAQVSNPYSTPVNNPDVPQNLHTYSQNVLIDVMSAVGCQITGIDLINPNQSCLGIDPTTGKIGFVENGGGAIGAMGSLIALTISPPIHSYDYSKYLANNFGLAKPALAKDEECKNGVGFCALSPLIKIWSIFRNIAYFILIIAFVLIGIAIMLRVKIDPRTVMSLGNQIPKIIMTIILITFSFAIAGLLIDFMWVAIYLILNIFHQALPEHFIIAQIDLSLGDSPFGALNSIFSSVGGLGLAKIVWHSSSSVALTIVDIFGELPSAGDIMLGLIWPPQAIENILLLLIAHVAKMAAFCIIGIALLIALFRIWFMLIMAYVTILIDVILAPLWIIVGIIPGTKGRGFGGWLRHITSKIMVFPVVICMFLLGKLFMTMLSETSATELSSMVPLLGLTGGANVISGLVGLGIILLTPKAASWMEQVFKPVRVDMTPIGQALKAGVGTHVAGGKAVAASQAPIHTPTGTITAGVWGALRQMGRF